LLSSAHSMFDGTQFMMDEEETEKVDTLPFKKTYKKVSVNDRLKFWADYLKGKAYDADPVGEGKDGEWSQKPL
jgi:hypothetical protein